MKGVEMLTQSKMVKTLAASAAGATDATATA